MTLADWDGVAGSTTSREVAPPDRAWRDRVLRAFDLLVSAGLAIVLLPLAAVVALLILSQRDGPVLFRQQRLGRNGELFTCLKFRTMRDGSEKELKPLLASNPRLHAQWKALRKMIGDPRVTPVGRVLRRIGVDEIPQVINVLRGEMSWVGPRPVVEEERARYGAFFAEYAAVRPGITGLWQVSRRDQLSYDQRVALDVDYVRRRSLWLNTRVLLRTPIAVLLTGRSA